MKAFTSHVNNREQHFSRAGLLFLLLVILGAAGDHEFHFSRTDARWNPESQTVQTTIRVFTDDLELALRNHHNLTKEVKIWLGDDGEWPRADSALHEWVQSHLDFRVGNQRLAWHWVGKEIELDVSFLYLESQPLNDRTSTWSAQNSMLFNEFEDQVNEVHLHDILPDGAPVERREMLNAEWPSVEWDSAAPADPGVDD